MIRWLLRRIMGPRDSRRAFERGMRERRRAAAVRELRRRAHRGPRRSRWSVMGASEPTRSIDVLDLVGGNDTKGRIKDE